MKGVFPLFYHPLVPAFIALVIYIFIGVPMLTSAVSTLGILTAYPLFLFGIGIIAYLFGSLVSMGKRAFFIFLLGYFLIDTIIPPLLVDFSTGISNLTAQQMLSGDVFLFSLFAKLSAPNSVNYILTYVIAPFGLIILLWLELRKKMFSMLIP